MNKAYIVTGFRSAVGKAGRGGFRFHRPDDIAASVIKHLMASVPQLDKDRIEIISIKWDNVYDQIVTNSNSINFNLEPGFYFLKISNEFRVINSKIIIK